MYYMNPASRRKGWGRGEGEEEAEGVYLVSLTQTTSPPPVTTPGVSDEHGDIIWNDTFFFFWGGNPVET